MRGKPRKKNTDRDGLFLVEQRPGRSEPDFPLVSVILVNSGGAGGIERALSCLYGQTFSNFETILVDDASGDHTAREVLERWPQTIVLQSRATLGFCRAANLAAEMALGKHLFFLGNNSWLSRKALGKLVEAIESEPRAGVVGPLLLNADGSLNCVGMNIDGLGREVVNREVFEADTDTVEDIFYVSGSALLVEKSLFLTLDGFDELYLNGREDADLCWRAKLMDRKVIVNPWAIAYRGQHYGVETNDYLVQRNSLRMLIKNYGTSRVAVGCARFVGSALFSSFKSLAALRPDVFWQYQRALVWNLVMLPDSIRQRRSVQRKRRQNDKSVLRHVVADRENSRDLSSNRAA